MLTVTMFVGNAPQQCVSMSIACFWLILARLCQARIHHGKETSNIAIGISKIEDKKEEEAKKEWLGGRRF